MFTRKPRLLVVDIETVGQMNASYGHPVNFGAKWYGERGVIVKDLRDYPETYKKAPWDPSALLCELADLIDSSDGVVTYFGKGYDWPMIQSFLTKADRFLKPVPHVDLYFLAKAHLKVGRGSMDAVSQFLELPRTKYHLAPITWVKAMHDNPEAMNLLKRRVVSDVQLTEALYRKLGPAQRAAPRLMLSSDVCRFCHQSGLRNEGTRITAAGVVKQRVRCPSCGHWDQRAA